MRCALARARRQLTERSRLYVASYIVGLARFILWLAQRLFRAGYI
jgi:hypothetical protein